MEDQEVISTLDGVMMSRNLVSHVAEELMFGRNWVRRRCSQGTCMTFKLSWIEGDVRQTNSNPVYYNQMNL